jgi:hypothetical protein
MVYNNMDSQAVYIKLLDHLRSLTHYSNYYSWSYSRRIEAEINSGTGSLVAMYSRRAYMLGYPSDPSVIHHVILR